MPKSKLGDHREREVSAFAVQGGSLDALLTRLAERQGRGEAIDRELAGMVAERPSVKLAGLDARLRTKLADWRGLHTRNVQQGREVLRAVLVGPLKFTPIDDGARRGYEQHLRREGGRG